MENSDTKVERFLVYPTIIDDVYWAKFNSEKKFNLKKHCFLNFLTSNLFANTIILPAKCILNHPFMFDLFRDNVDKFGNQFKRVISLLLLNKDGYPLDSVAEELLGRLKKNKDSMNIKSQKKIKDFTTMLKACDLHLIYKNKLEFHKQYLRDIINWIRIFNLNGFPMDAQTILPQNELTSYLNALENEQQKEMTETDYFGAKIAEQLVKDTVPVVFESIKKFVNAIWIYNSSQLFKHETIIPKEYSFYWSILNKKDPTSLPLKIDFFPVGFYFKETNFTIKDIADLSNSIAFIRFRSLIKEFNEQNIEGQVKIHDVLLSVYEEVVAHLLSYAHQKTSAQKKSILNKLRYNVEKIMEQQQKDKKIYKIVFEKIHDYLGYLSMTTTLGAVRLGIKAVTEPAKLIADLGNNLGLYDEQIEVTNLQDIVELEKPTLNIANGSVDISKNTQESSHWE